MSQLAAGSMLLRAGWCSDQTERYSASVV